MGPKQQHAAAPEVEQRMEGRWQLAHGAQAVVTRHAVCVRRRGLMQLARLPCSGRRYSVLLCPCSVLAVGLLACLRRVHRLVRRILLWLRVCPLPVVLLLVLLLLVPRALLLHVGCGDVLRGGWPARGCVRVAALHRRCVCPMSGQRRRRGPSGLRRRHALICTRRVLGGRRGRLVPPWRPRPTRMHECQI